MASTRTRNGAVIVEADGSVHRRAPEASRAPARGRVDLRLLLPAVIAWAAAAALLAAPATVRICLGCLLGIGGAVLTHWGRPRHRRGRHTALRVGLCALATGLVLGVGGAAEAVRRAGPIDELAARSGVARISGLVRSEPIDIGHGRFLLRVGIDRVSTGAASHSVATQILVIGDQRWADAQWHDRVQALLRLRPAEPGEAVLAVGKPLGPPILSRSESALVRWSSSVRQALREAVSSLPQDPRGLVPAMVFGDTSRSPPALTDDMRVAGLSHLAAVSGANVSLLLAAVLPLLALLGVPRRARPPCLIVVVALFVLVTRPEPSVIRAAVMGVVGLLAIYRSTRGAGPPALASAILLLLLIDPWLARSAGFALSALATLGLVLFAGPWTDALAPRLPGGSQTVAATLVVPVAAMLMTAPVIVILQGVVSLVGLPANILAAPLVAPVTIAGLALTIWALLAPPVAVLAWLPGAPAALIAQIAHRAAGLSWASLDWPDGPTGALLLALIGLVLLVFGPRLWSALRARSRAVLPLALLASALLMPTSRWSWPPPGWQFVACDVGQGDALVLASGPGRAVLVDAGPDSQLVDRCLRRLRIRTLDLVVLTHFHADHVDGLAGAVRERSVGAILVSPVAEPAPQAAAVAALADRGGIPMRAAAAGEQMTLGDLRIQVLGPQRRIEAGSVANNASVVLAVTAGDFAALLTGDIEAEAGAALRQQLSAGTFGVPGGAHVDLIKAPHHGSADLDAGLSAQVRAPLVVVSVGAENDYGHPSPRMLDLARGAGSQVRRTDLDGDIAVWAVGDRVLVRTSHRW